MSGRNSSTSVTDLILLGDKSKRGKAFSFKEIQELEDEYAQEGLYHEGIQENDIQFKLDIIFEGFSSNISRSIVGDPLIFDNDGELITMEKLDYSNCYLNIGNWNASNWTFMEDEQEYHWEISGEVIHSSVITANVTPGSLFGTPFATGNYKYPTWWFVKKQNVDQPSFGLIQTDNPNVKAFALAFLPRKSMGWYDNNAFSQSAGKVTVNGEVIYDYLVNGAKNDTNLFAGERYTDILGNAWITRYVFVKNVDEETSEITYTVYKSYTSDTSTKTTSEEIIYLRSDVTGLMKEHTLQELIDTNRTDGIYNDNYDWHLDLLFRQMWTTQNSGEVLLSGASVVTEDDKILGPYTFARKAKTSPLTGVYELIVGDIPDTEDKFSVMIDSDKTTQTEPVAFGRQFHKSVSTYTGGNTAGKIASFLNINVTGGINNEMNLRVSFEKPIKAFILDTVSTYDALYNPGNAVNARHPGYLKSITHDEELLNYSTFADWTSDWLLTVDGLIYGSRMIFTKEKCIHVFVKISGQTLKEMDMDMYVYDTLLEVMKKYTLDEILDLDSKGKLNRGRLVAEIVYTVEVPFKFTRTFDTDDNLVGFSNISMFNKNGGDEETPVTYERLEGYIRAQDDVYKIGGNIYSAEVDTKLLEDKSIINGLIDNKTNSFLIENVNNSVEYKVLTDNEDMKIVSVIPWGGRDLINQPPMLHTLQRLDIYAPTGGHGTDTIYFRANDEDFVQGFKAKDYDDLWVPVFCGYHTTEATATNGPNYNSESNVASMPGSYYVYILGDVLKNYPSLGDAKLLCPGTTYYSTTVVTYNSNPVQPYGGELTYETNGRDFISLEYQIELAKTSKAWGNQTDLSSVDTTPFKDMIVHYVEKLYNTYGVVIDLNQMMIVYLQSYYTYYNSVSSGNNGLSGTLRSRGWGYPAAYQLDSGSYFIYSPKLGRVASQRINANSRGVYGGPFEVYNQNNVKTCQVADGFVNWSIKDPPPLPVIKDFNLERFDFYTPTRQYGTPRVFIRQNLEEFDQTFDSQTYDDLYLPIYCWANNVNPSLDGVIIDCDRGYECGVIVNVLIPSKYFKQNTTLANTKLFFADTQKITVSSNTALTTTDKTYNDKPTKPVGGYGRWANNLILIAPDKDTLDPLVHTTRLCNNEGSMEDIDLNMLDEMIYEAVDHLRWTYNLWDIDIDDIILTYEMGFNTYGSVNKNSRFLGILQMTGKGFVGGFRQESASLFVYGKKIGQIAIEAQDVHIYNSTPGTNKTYIYNKDKKLVCTTTEKLGVIDNWNMDGIEEEKEEE